MKPGKREANSFKVDNGDSELVVIDECSDSDSDVNCVYDPEVVVLDESKSKTNNNMKKKSSNSNSSNAKGRKSPASDDVQSSSRLLIENNKLAEELAQLKGIDSFNIGSDADNPCLKVLFFDEGFSRAYKDDVERFLHNLYTKYKSGRRTQEPPSFFIDNNSDAGACGDQSFETPFYNTDFSEALVDEEPKSKDDQAENINKIDKPKMTCFNCLGDHMIGDCTEPRNHQRISQNRNAHFKQFGGGRQTRYHIENDPRFAKYKPGSISQDLRDALNLRKNEMPLYIYKMRTLGYPPGWLMEATVESSGITMYDSEGKEIAEDNLEDGEVTRPTSPKIQYDSSKLIDYPGFNVAMEAGMVDVFQQLGFPPMQPHHSKSFFELHMKRPEATPFKRRQKAQDKKESAKKPCTISRQEEDMEIEGQELQDAGCILPSTSEDDTCKFIPPLPREEVSKPPLPSEPPPPSSESEDEQSSSRRSSRAASPTLEFLEQQKQQLLSQLTGSMRGPSAFSTPKTSGVICSEGGSASDSDTSMSQEASLPVKLTRSTSKSMALGTPILKSISPFAMLPDSDKFSTGITEHLNFENLPNSTGVYENKFKSILDKVRARNNNF